MSSFSIERVSIFAALGISALVAMCDGWLMSHGLHLGAEVLTLSVLDTTLAGLADFNGDAQPVRFASGR